MQDEPGPGDGITFFVRSRPASANNSRKPRYRSKMVEAARSLMTDRTLLPGPLYARITWIHFRPREQDVDNIAKPLLDALREVVYEDDRLIEQCLVTSIDGTDLSTSGLEPTVADALTRYLEEPSDHLLMVEVGRLRSTPQPRTGPPDAPWNQP